MAASFSTSALTFSESLDTTALVWTSGGDNSWYATNASSIPTFDGVDAAASGQIGDDGLSWLETTVNGPGKIRFWWSCETEEPYDPVIFKIAGDEVAAISGEQNWKYESYTITNVGPVSLRWEYSRDSSEGLGDNKAYLDQVKFETGNEVPLATALNSAFASWLTGGKANPTYWVGQTNTFRADGISAESGAITTSQVSEMETTIYGVTNLSFWWKVSSVTNQGYLRFYTNNVQVFQISGEVGWQSKTNITLNGGTNTLRWSCETTEIAIGKLNRGWVDEVNFKPAFGPSAPLVLGQPVMTNGQAQFDVNFQAGWPCRVQYSTNLASGVWIDLLATNTSSAVTTIVDAGATNSPEGRFYRAVAP